MIWNQNPRPQDVITTFNGGIWVTRIRYVYVRNGVLLFKHGANRFFVSRDHQDLGTTNQTKRFFRALLIKNIIRRPVTQTLKTRRQRKRYGSSEILHDFAKSQHFCLLVSQCADRDQGCCVIKCWRYNWSGTSFCTWAADPMLVLEHVRIFLASYLFGHPPKNYLVCMAMISLVIKYHAYFMNTPHSA